MSIIMSCTPPFLKRTKLVAAQPRGPHQLDRAQGVGRDDVELDAVAALHPEDGGLAGVPGEGDDQGVAGADGGDAGEEDAEGAGGDRGESDRPEAGGEECGRGPGRAGGGGAGGGGGGEGGVGRPPRGG